jgi:hypothetical protein
LSHALAGNLKEKNTLELLGCSIENFRLYISSKFVNGMSWENYGYHTWHIDHIIPCWEFDLSDKEQQKKCFHFSNMRPLWAKDNIIKSSKRIYLI